MNSTARSLLNPAVYDKITNMTTDYVFYINVFIGIMIVSAILVFILQTIKLGYQSTLSSPALLAKIKHDMMITAICTASLGSIMFIYNIIIYTVAG